jgi:DNA-binding transcriptional MerR regulator
MKTASHSHAVSSPAQSPKLFYRIQEVAKLTGLKPYVLRYWETEFKELAPAKDGSDQRRYRPSDIEVILTIRKLLYEDRFTIEGARKRLKDEIRLRREPLALQLEAPQPKPAPASAKAKLAVADQGGKPGKLDQSLNRLRTEVNALLQLLSA